jgi:glycine/D-amino acid oxidase-like deaminating enzyme
VLVIGAGIIGTACAWQLACRGHQVLLLEPAGSQDPSGKARTASHAALGLLMAQTSHRPRGRAWRLRQRGIALWREWRLRLRDRGHRIGWREGLLLLAADPGELQRQRRLVAERQAMGLPLAIWERERLAALDPAVPTAALGALHSPCDAQIDPGQALTALRADALTRGVEVCGEAAEVVERSGSPRPLGWRVRLRGGGAVEGEWVVLAAGVNSSDLLRGVAMERPLEPVLGQALELELVDEDLGRDPTWTNWPGALSWQGIHLVPRPDLAGGARLWLGATLEPGRVADPAALDQALSLHGAAPGWLRRARQVRSWWGLRPRPVGRPAPLLEEIAPTLLLAMGHFRNGVLLAPATAEWVTDRIEAAAAREPAHGVNPPPEGTP